MQKQEVKGIFKNRKSARKAILPLLEAGIPRDDIHIVESDDDYAEAMQFKLQSRISIVAIVSAAIGGVVGALATSVVQISPVIAAILGVTIGTLMGSVIGTLIGSELTENETHEIAEGRRTNCMIQVTSHGLDDKDIGKLLKRQGAIQVKNAA